MNTCEEIDELIAGAANSMSSLRDFLEKLVCDYNECKIIYYDTEKHEYREREECEKNMKVLREHINCICDFVNSQKEEFMSFAEKVLTDDTLPPSH